MLVLSSEEIRRRLAEETDALLVQRSRAGIGIAISSIALFAIADLALRPAILGRLYVVKILQLVLLGGLLVVLGGPMGRRRPLFVALAGVAAICFTTAASGVVSRDALTTPLLFIVLAMATATLLPWGVWNQAAAVAIAAASMLWNLVAVEGSLRAAIGYPATAAAVAFAASIYIAAEFDRYRIAIEQRNVELRGYRDVVENANDAIVILDRRYRVAGANSGAEILFGYRREDLLGRPVEDLFPAEDPENVRATWRRVPDGDPAQGIFSLDARRKDGQTIPLEIKARAVETASGGAGIQAIMRDVTAKRIIDQMRNDFVAMLSHDIKIPLSSILGFVQMIREARHLDLKLLDRIDANAEVALALATNFVEVFRLESGPLELARQKSSLNSIVTEVLRHQESLARARQITVAAALAPDLDELEVDPRLIERAVANLVSNAIKFAPPQTTVSIVTRAEEGAVAVDFRDHGPGIAPGDRHRLFQRYGRVGSARAEGTGLGLFIVKQIVDAHGGRVTVDCPPGGGSVFTVSLPTAAPPS